MATVFDGDNLLITLNAGGAIHTVDAQVDLYSDWKEWVKSAGSKFPQAFDTSGGDPLTAGITAGAYFFLRNDLGWRIKPAEEDATITMVGNLAPRDASLATIVPTTGAFTVAVLGLQPITQNVDQLLVNQQAAAFDGFVSLDLNGGGEPGTTWPIGTKSRPVDNIADMITIADREGLQAVLLTGSMTLTQDFAGWIIVGTSSSENDKVALAGFSVNGTHFENVEISGAAAASPPNVISADMCSFVGLSNIRGHFQTCGIKDDITIIAGQTTMHECFSQVPGNTKPFVDLNGQNCKLNHRGYNGGIELRGCSHASAAVTLDMNTGRILLASSCTAGEIVVGGVGEFDDQSAGSTIIDAILTPERQKRILKATAYRQYTNPSTGNLDIYDDADTLDQSVPIFEDDGVTAWDGVGPIVRRNKIT